MDIEKEFSVAAPQAEVWEFVTSAEKVATCMPGVESIQVHSPGKYKGVMKVKVGPIKTVVKADVNEVEQRAPDFAAYLIKGEEGGRASRMTVESNIFLSSSSADQTNVRFTSHVVIVGRLGKFAGGVMNKIADSISEKFIMEIRRHLEPELPAEQPRKGILARFMEFLRGLFGRSNKANP